MAKGFSAVFLDFVALNKAINDILIKNNEILRLCDEYLLVYFNTEKDQILGDFRDHPVTQEILAGPSPMSNNISGTLSGRSGNLFSFLGFNREDRPVEQLELLLDRTIGYTNKAPKRNLYSVGFTKSFSIQVPTYEEVRSTTQLRWSDDSWALGVEKGFSGLTHYLFHNFTNNPTSRSGWGLQVAKINRDSEFTKVPYIQSMLKNFISAVNAPINQFLP